MSEKTDLLIVFVFSLLGFVLLCEWQNFVFNVSINISFSGSTNSSEKIWELGQYPQQPNPLHRDRDDGHRVGHHSCRSG